MMLAKISALHVSKTSGFFANPDVLVILLPVCENNFHNIWGTILGLCSILNIWIFYYSEWTNTTLKNTPLQKPYSSKSV